jgi:hypothetical protein
MSPGVKGYCALKELNSAANGGHSKHGKELQTHARCKDWIEQQLSSWRRKLLAVDAERAKERERIEALAP